MWLLAAFSLDELCWECFSSRHPDLQPLHSTRVYFSLRKGKYLWIKEEKQWSCELGSLGVWQGLPELVGVLQVSWQLQERDLDVKTLQDRSAKGSQGKKGGRAERK